MQLQPTKCKCGCTWFYTSFVNQFANVTTMAGTLPPCLNNFNPQCLVCAKCGQIKFPSPDAMDMKQPDYILYNRIIDEIES